MISLRNKCQTCDGTGKANIYNETTHETVLVDPCPICLGLGCTESNTTIDSALLDDILDQVKIVKKTVENIAKKVGA